VLGLIDDRDVRLLARVERNVGVSQQRLRIRAVLREECDPNARLELQCQTVDGEGIVQRTPDALCDEERARAVARAAE